MKITAHLVDPEESIIVEFDARDRRAFERAGYKALGLSGALAEAIQRVPDSYMAWLLWHALRRQELIDVSFDDFDARFVDYDKPQEVIADENPTSAAT